MHADRARIEAEIGSCLDRGDLPAAATCAIRGYGRPILLFLAVLMNDEESAKEVFSQFAEELWRGIGKFRRESTLWTWAHTIARAAAYRYLREPHRHRVRRLRTSEWGRLAEETLSASAHHIDASRERFRRLQEQLDPDERALLILRIDDEMSWAEIGEVMSVDGQAISEVALRNRFQRLKRKLKKLAQQDATDS